MPTFAAEKRRDMTELAAADAKDATDFFVQPEYTQNRKPAVRKGGAAVAVYIDLVMILNFLVDLLLILGTNRLSGFPPGIKRGALAAALGAAYSGACMLPGFHFLMNTIWRLVSLMLMGIIAFGWNKSALKRCGLFVLLSMALGGVALGFGSGSFWMLILAAGAVWLLCRIGFGGSVGQREYVTVRISHQGETVSVVALRDTGNTLRDPVTGEQVLVIGAEIARRLTGLQEEQLRVPLETLAAKPVRGLRLIPYRAVGQSGGMLLAMRFSDVKIGSRSGSAIVAFAPEAVGKGECYQALTGGAV